MSLFKVILNYDISADLNSQDTYGNTPVHLAAQIGRVDVLKLFLKKQLIKLSIKNSEGYSAIECAKDNETLKVSKQSIINSSLKQVFFDYITHLRSL